MATACRQGLGTEQPAEGRHAASFEKRRKVGHHGGGRGGGGGDGGYGKQQRGKDRGSTKYTGKKTKEWIGNKKDRQRRQGKEVRHDSKYTGRKRKERF